MSGRKKMKKILATLLAILMVFTLAGCGAKEDTAAAPAEDEAFKIALCLNGTLGDKSFFDSGNEGMKMIKDKYGDKVVTDVLEFTYDDTTWQSQLENVFASESYDVIIVGTYDMLEMTVALTGEYPDQKVWFYDETWDFDANPRDNVISLLFKQNEGSYLVGYLAAMASKNNHVSFCGGMSNTVLLDFAAGYEQGAKAYNPDCKVDITWMDSFSESSKGKDVASASYAQGVDVVFACGGGAGLGCFDAALEYDDVYVIGVDGDQGAMWADAGEADKAAKTLTSMTKNVNVGFFDTFEKELAGTLEYGKNYKLGVEGGYVSAVVNDATTAALGADVADTIKQLSKDIVSGAIKVNTAF